MEMKKERFWRVDYLFLLGAVLLFCPIRNVQGQDFTIPEIKLLDSEFASTNWGGSVNRTDAKDDGVLFLFSGLSSSTTGIKDDYMIDTVYGQILPSHVNGNFSNFDGLIQTFENLDAQPVSISLFINTGFTGPSGIPSNNLDNDTFWYSPWTEIQPGQRRDLHLDFDNALPWNIEDNPPPHTQGSNGQWTSINSFDRTEVSAIGFQIIAQSNPEAAIIASPAHNPICSLALKEDFNGNCKVDLVDFSYWATQWLQCNLVPESECWK